MVTSSAPPERQRLAGYYLGHSNDCLWPLFHYRVDLMHFDRGNFETYNAVNRRFAEALSPLLKPSDVVWVHDYHMIPLARELRRLGHTQAMGFFLHIPFPASPVLKCLPEHEGLVADLCAYDLVGVQTVQDRTCLWEHLVMEIGGAALKDGRVRAFGRSVTIEAFPVGIDVEALTKLAESTAAERIIATMSQSVRGTALIIGVDRLDYTKGLCNRFQAFRRLLEKYPETRRRVTFLQIAAKSRDDVKSYDELRQQIDQIVGAIQGDYADVDWNPVRYVRRGVARSRVAALYRASKVGLVTPLRDGMNLVAKEYIAAQDPDDPGVLILSQFAGAAEEMSEAVLVNPHDSEGLADALHRAVHMPLDERQRRHRALLTKLRRTDAAAWRHRFLTTLTRVTSSPRQLDTSHRPQ